MSIVTADGFEIASHFFRPKGEPLASALIVPAMGVSQRYYQAFAAWLSQHGFLAATFDYRGIGRSREGNLRGFQADIFDWSRLDCAAMVDALAREGRSIYWIGHSLGAQILPLVPNGDRVTKMIAIATGSGYWREHPVVQRPVSWWLWYVAVPLAVRVCGYFPGRRLRKVGDLPKGVIEQWRRWCLNSDYSAGAEGEEIRDLYTRLETSILSISFTDDEYMSARSTDSLLRLYASAPKKSIRLAPSDIGVERIGHFGFFRSEFEQSLWHGLLLPELAPR
jgi:predicted alpha/beta hydrolase